MKKVPTIAEMEAKRTKHRVVCADPPWSFRDSMNAGKRGAVHKYDTMTLAEICSMRVVDHVADDAVLFLWCPLSMLETHPWPVMKAWGFEFKTGAFTWIKTNKRAPTLFTGCGNWTRSNPEICLLATRGKPKRVSKSVHSVIVAPAGEHSAKPREAMDRINELMGINRVVHQDDAEAIELFARRPEMGWNAWGNGVTWPNPGRALPLLEHALNEHFNGEPPCEACGNPATELDIHGIPLCSDCYNATD